MVRKFYNTPANVYRFWQEKVRGSLVQKKTSLYQNIMIAFWKQKKQYWVTQLANQTPLSAYEVNLKPWYEVLKWDIFEIYDEVFKVDDVIPHHRSNWMLDNYQVFISKTDND